MPKLEKLEYVFATTNGPLEYNTPNVVRALQQHNPSLLLAHYRNTGQKEQAIELLIRMSRRRKPLRFAQEIVYTFIYFADFEGALRHIQYYELTSLNIMSLGSLIKFSLSAKEKEDECEVVRWLMDNFQSEYIAERVRALVAYFQRIHGKAWKSHIMPHLIKIEALLTPKYVNVLTYEEAHYLYKALPHKPKYLRRMVKINPGISKRYYFLYAKMFGIEKQDIVGILLHRYRSWAFRIAFNRGWVDSHVWSSVVQLRSQAIVFINREAEWTHGSDRKGILFFRDDMDSKSAMRNRLD